MVSNRTSPSRTMRRLATTAAVLAVAAFASGCASDEIRPPFVQEKAAPASSIEGKIVVTTRGDVEYSLATYDPATDELQPVADTDGARSPAFSPDGTRIAAAFDNEGEGGIVVIGANERQNVVEAPGYFDHPSWSPDGTRLAYAHHPTDGSWDIYVIDLSTHQITQLTSTASQDWYPSWSPSGNRIAFTSDRDGDNAVWLLDVGSGTASKLVDSEGADAEPSWSPDGASIVFSSDRELHTWQIHVVPSAGGEDERLVRSDTVDRYPIYSPDGQYVLVSTGYLALYAADGKELSNKANRWKLADELTFSAAWAAG